MQVPLGCQDAGRHLVDDWTWQGMCLMELLAAGPRGTVSAGVRRPAAIAPTFGPASGWYQPGQYSPGSMTDRKEMRAAALPCTVVVLRRQGARVPAAQLLRAEPPSGFLLCMDQYTAPNWHACLFGDEEMRTELLPRLLHARLERENNGVRLYGGIEVDAQGRQEWRQAWLCTPTPERAREILVEMLGREGGA